MSGRGRGLPQWWEWLRDSRRVIGGSVTVRAHGRRSFPLPLWGFGLRVLLLLQDTSHDLTTSGQRGGGGRTEALLEALSSSLLVGGAAPLRKRGEDTGALRRGFGGFAWESSYSSARAKRSLNLQAGPRCHTRARTCVCVCVSVCSLTVVLSVAQTQSQVVHVLQNLL